VDFAEDRLSSDARDAVARADAIAHLAVARDRRALAPEARSRINVTSGALLLRHARSASRFLFVSSVGVHGYTSNAPIDETSPLAPYDSYGREKVAAEAAVSDTARETDIAATIVRPGIVYGPGDTYGMITNMIRLIARRRFLWIGAGSSRVQLLHVADVVAGLRAALLRPEAAGQTLLLSGSEAVAIIDLTRTIARRLHVWVPPVGVPESFARRAASVCEGVARLLGRNDEPFLTQSKINLFTRDYVCDTSRAFAVLGFRPAVTVERGVDETVSWLNEYRLTREQR
jgi:nucleoside-diphosphate-sugar epimerase